MKPLLVCSAVCHGFGVRSTTKGAVGGWPGRFEEWLGDRDFLKQP